MRRTKLLEQISLFLLTQLVFLFCFGHVGATSVAFTWARHFQATSALKYAASKRPFPAMAWGSPSGTAGSASAAVIDVEAVADQEALAGLHRLSAAGPAEAAPAPAWPPPDVPPPVPWESMELPAAS